MLVMKTTIILSNKENTCDDPWRKQIYIWATAAIGTKNNVNG